MIVDIFTPLEKKLIALLQPLNIPVFVQAVPDSMADQSYILLSEGFSNNRSTRNSTNLVASYRITIYAFDLKYPKKTCREIAAQVHSVIQDRTRIAVNEQFPNVDVEFVNDLTSSQQEGVRYYYNMTLNFRFYFDNFD